MTTADRLDVDTAGVGCYRSLGTVDRDGTLEVFEPTVHTASGWGPNMQHGGPVSGLLTRAIERHQRPGTRISRVTVEIRPQTNGCELTLTHERDARWAEYADRSRDPWAKMVGVLETMLHE